MGDVLKITDVLKCPACEGIDYRVEPDGKIWCSTCQLVIDAKVVFEYATDEVH